MDNDFSHIGKRTPYRVPQDFFLQSRERILDATIRQEASAPRSERPTTFHPWAWMGAAAAAILVVSIAWWARPSHEGLSQFPPTELANAYTPQQVAPEATTITPSASTPAEARAVDTAAPASPPPPTRKLKPQRSAPPPAPTQSEASGAIYSNPAQLSADEQATWMAFAEADLFLSEE